MPADATLKANAVLSASCIKPEIAKKPEQAGWYFALLQKKFYRIQLKAAIKAGNDKDADGNLIVLEDSEDEQLETVEKKNEKYVPTRTRE
jgi:curved DNA-binding protein CbpA